MSDEPIEYQTAFIVYVDLDGQVGITTDVTKPFSTEREAGEDDVRRCMADCLYILDKRFQAGLLLQVLKGAELHKGQDAIQQKNPLERARQKRGEA